MPGFARSESCWNHLRHFKITKLPDFRIELDKQDLIGPEMRVCMYTYIASWFFEVLSSYLIRWSST